MTNSHGDLASGSSPFRVLRNSNYRMYFGGQLISMSGTWMQSIAQSWLVYRLSGSGAWLGAVAFANQIPAFLLSPVAGVVADRLDRRRILIITQVVSALQALLLSALIFFGHVQLWHIVCFAVVLGVVNAFEITTRHAFGVDMVGKEDLASAIALNSVLINGSRIIGPMLAGFVITAVGEAWCFLFNGLSYLPVLWGFVRMRLETRQPQAQASDKSIAREFSEGLQYASTSSTILGVLVFSTLICLFATPFAVLLPIFSKAILGGDASTLALLTGMAGAGAMFGALFSIRQGGGRDLWLQLGAHTLVFGAALILLGISKVIWFSLGTVFVAGYCMMNVFPAMNNALQQTVADTMRGRVLSLYTMSFLGAVPLGSLAMGFGADHLGAPRVSILAGFLTLLIGASALWARAAEEKA